MHVGTRTPWKLGVLHGWKRSNERHTPRGVAQDGRNVIGNSATNLSARDSLKPWYRPRGLAKFLTGNFVLREPRRKHPPEFRARSPGNASGCNSNDNNSFCIIHFVRASVKTRREIGFTDRLCETVPLESINTPPNRYVLHRSSREMQIVACGPFKSTFNTKLSRWGEWKGIEIVLLWISCTVHSEMLVDLTTTRLLAARLGWYHQRAQLWSVSAAFADLSCVMFSGGRVKDGWNYSKMNAPAAEDISCKFKRPRTRRPFEGESTGRKSTGFRCFCNSGERARPPVIEISPVQILVNAEKTVWISGTCDETETVTNEVLKGDFHRLIKNRAKNVRRGSRERTAK